MPPVDVELHYCYLPRFLYLLYASFLQFHDEVSRATSTEHISVSNADFLSRNLVVYKEFEYLDEDYLQRVIFVRSVLEHLERIEGPFETGSVLSEVLIGLANFQSITSHSSMWRDGYHIFLRDGTVENLGDLTVDISRGGKITVTRHGSLGVTTYDQVPFPVSSDVLPTDPKIRILYPVEPPASLRASGTSFALERFLVAMYYFNQLR
jgi:hypothetical protein